MSIFVDDAIALGFSPVVIPACAGMTGFFAEWVGEGGRGHLSSVYYIIAIVAPA